MQFQRAIPPENEFVDVVGVAPPAKVEDKIRVHYVQRKLALFQAGRVATVINRLVVPPQVIPKTSQVAIHLSDYIGECSCCTWHN